MWLSKFTFHYFSSDFPHFWGTFAKYRFKCAEMCNKLLINKLFYVEMWPSHLTNVTKKCTFRCIQQSHFYIKQFLYQWFIAHLGTFEPIFYRCDETLLKKSLVSLNVRFENYVKSQIKNVSANMWKNVCKCETHMWVTDFL